MGPFQAARWRPPRRPSRGASTPTARGSPRWPPGRVHPPVWRFLESSSALPCASLRPGPLPVFGTDGPLRPPRSWPRPSDAGPCSGRGRGRPRTRSASSVDSRRSAGTRSGLSRGRWSSPRTSAGPPRPASRSRGAGRLPPMVGGGCVSSTFAKKRLSSPVVTRWRYAPRTWSMVRNRSPSPRPVLALGGRWARTARTRASRARSPRPSSARPCRADRSC